jgi:hypothetical protein
MKELYDASLSEFNFKPVGRLTHCRNGKLLNLLLWLWNTLLGDRKKKNIRIQINFCTKVAKNSGMLILC